MARVPSPSKKRAVLSSDEDDHPSSPVKSSSAAARPPRPSASPPAQHPPPTSEGETLHMGTSPLALKSSQPVFQPAADELDALDDFDWGDDVAAAQPALTATPMDVDLPTLLVPGGSSSTPTQPALSTSTPTKPKPSPLRLSTSAQGSPRTNGAAGPASPTSALMARIQADAKEYLARKSRLKQTLSAELASSKGKGKQVDSDSEGEESDLGGMDIDFGFGTKGGDKDKGKGRETVSRLSDSEDDEFALPAIRSKASKTAPKRPAKDAAELLVLHDPTSRRLRQKITTSSSSSKPAFVTRGTRTSSPTKMSPTDMTPSGGGVNRFMALLRKSKKRSAMLDRVGQISAGGADVALSDSEEDESTTSDPTKLHARSYVDGGGPHGGPSSFLDYSTSEESSAEDDDDGQSMGVLGEAAGGISEVLLKDKLANIESRRLRREMRKTHWRGCWVRLKSKKQLDLKEGEPIEEIELMEKASWDFFHLKNDRTSHPLFRRLYAAVEPLEDQDNQRLAALLALGALSPAVFATVTNKQSVATSLLESACLLSHEPLRQLSYSSLLNLITTSAATPPTADGDGPLFAKSGFLIISAALKKFGYKFGLIEEVAKAGDGTPKKKKKLRSAQGEILDMPVAMRCKAVQVIASVVEVVVTHRLMADTDIVKMICLLVFISLDKTSPVGLRISLDKAISVALGCITSPDYEYKLCCKLVDLGQMGDMNFKLGILNALPRMGVREGRLVRALGMTFLNGIVPKSTFNSPPNIQNLTKLVSQSPDDKPPSKFLINQETDYVQLIAAIRVLAIVVGDMETFYSGEAGATKEAAKSAREQVSANLKALQQALGRTEGRIMDARASNLDKSAAKAFLLNLKVSLGFKSAAFEKLYQPKLAKGELGRKGQTQLEGFRRDVK